MKHYLYKHPVITGLRGLSAPFQYYPDEMTNPEVDWIVNEVNKKISLQKIRIRIQEKNLLVLDDEPSQTKHPILVLESDPDHNDRMCILEDDGT